MRIVENDTVSRGHCCVQDHRGKISYPLDGYLKKNLQGVKKLIQKDLDYVFIVAGKVGSGKSVFAQLIGHYLSDGKMGVDQVVFTADDFRGQVMKAPRYQCIVWDECFRGASSRASMSATNKTIHSLMQEIRQKNLFIILVLPNFWDLDSYLIRERSKGIFEVYSKLKRTEAGDPDIDRGHFRYYSSSKLIGFMNNQKNRYQWPNRRYADFYGKWTNQYSINGKSVPLLKSRYRYLVGAAEYIKKKNSALGEYGDSPEDAQAAKKMGKYEIYLLNTIYYLLKNKIMTLTQFMKGSGMTEMAMRTFRKNAIEENCMPRITWNNIYKGIFKEEDVPKTNVSKIMNEKKDTKSAQQGVKDE